MRTRKPTTVRLNRTLRDGTEATVTHEVESPGDEILERVLDAGEDNERPDMMFPGAITDPAAEAIGEVAGKFGSTATDLEIKLYQGGAFKRNLSLSEATPEFIQAECGPGNYEVRFYRGATLVKTVPAPIGIPGKVEPPKEDFFARAQAQLTQGGGDSNTSLIGTVLLMFQAMHQSDAAKQEARVKEMAEETRYRIAQMENETKMRIAQMESDQRNRAEERARADKRDELVLNTILKRNDSSEALGSILTFMSDMGRTIANIAQPESGGLPSKLLDLFGPSVSGVIANFAEKMANQQQPARAPLPAPAPGVAAPQPQPQPAPPQNGGANAQNDFVMMFENNLLPDLIRAATQSKHNPEDDLWEPWEPSSFAETIRFTALSRWEVPPETLAILIVQFFGSFNQFATRYPGVMQNAAWFNELWVELTELPVDEESATIPNSGTVVETTQGPQVGPIVTPPPGIVVKN